MCRGGLAQLGEHNVRNVGVGGSNPLPSTTIIDTWSFHLKFKVLRMAMANPKPWQKFCDVIKTEEKGSDVNLAVHLLNDAWQDKYDYGVVVSNDSDLAESLRLVKKQHRKKIIVLVPGDPTKRPPAIQLKRFAHKIQSIPLEAMAASQLPNPIPGTTIHKPKAW